MQTALTPAPKPRRLSHYGFAIVFVAMAIFLSLVLPTLLFDGALLAVLLIALRMIWVFAESWVSQVIRRLVQRPEPPLPPKEKFIVGWTGMRGVIALAAAISLPELLDDGTAFPQRDVLIFLAFSVILVTLVVQGLSLPWLIRKLGLADLGSANGEEHRARRQMLSAAIDRIQDLGSTEAHGNEEILADMLHHYQQRLDETNTSSASASWDGTNYDQYRRLENELRAVERSTVLHLRERNQINDEVLRTLERELDLLDARYLTVHG